MLRAGSERFASGAALHPYADAARLALAAKEDQADHAYATVISCSDSRVPVELIFDAGVMDLFVQSAAVRELVAAGKARVAGAIYDIGTGKVGWLPSAKVDAILRNVEAAPGKATEP